MLLCPTFSQHATSTGKEITKYREFCSYGTVVTINIVKLSELKVDVSSAVDRKGHAVGANNDIS